MSDDTEPMPKSAPPEPPPAKRNQSRMLGLMSLGLFVVVAIGAIVIWQWDGDGSTPSRDTEAPATADDEADADPPPVVAGGASLRITSDGDSVSLAGTVSSQDEADDLAAAAQRAFGGASSDLTIDDSLDSAPWIAAMPDLLRDLAAVDGAGLEVDGARLRISGSVPTDAERVDLANTAASLFPEMRIDNSLVVAGGGGDGTANFLLIENADGTVTLRGDIPSTAITERLVSNASGIYGADNVVDEMVLTGSGEPDWLRSMTRIIRDLRRVQGAEVDAGYTTKGTLILSGTVNNEQDRDRVVGRFAEAMPDFTIDDRLVVGSSNTAGRSTEEQQARAALRAATEQISDANVLFATASAEISAQGADFLDEIATILNEHPSVAVEVAGHTDSQGTPEDNLALSQARADSVLDFLVDAGIDEGRLASVGYGETRPVGDNDTAEGRAQNRRIEFTVTDR